MAREGNLMTLVRVFWRKISTIQILLETCLAMVETSQFSWICKTWFKSKSICEDVQMKLFVKWNLFIYLLLTPTPRLCFPPCVSHPWLRLWFLYHSNVVSSHLKQYKRQPPSQDWKTPLNTTLIGSTRLTDSSPTLTTTLVLNRCSKCKLSLILIYNFD